jgi:hypothetical protein
LKTKKNFESRCSLSFSNFFVNKLQNTASKFFVFSCTCLFLGLICLVSFSLLRKRFQLQPQPCAVRVLNSLNLSLAVKLADWNGAVDNVHVHLSLLCFSLTPTSPRVRSCECECIHEVSSFLSPPVILPTHKLMTSSPPLARSTRRQIDVQLIAPNKVGLNLNIFFL